MRRPSSFPVTMGSATGEMKPGSMSSSTCGNLQSYWTTTKLWKLTVVLDYYEAMETYSRIGLLRIYGNLQSYLTAKKLWKLTVALK
jgi:hypothetical protein